MSGLPRWLKPMLAADASTTRAESLNYPLLASPKLDGVRALVWEGQVYSRNGKLIRNNFVQEWARTNNVHALDGELIVGSPTEPLCLNATVSGVMSAEGQPNFGFYMFDRIPTGDCPFYARLATANTYARNKPRIIQVPHLLLTDAEDLTRVEGAHLADGYEGIMLRSPNGPYKHGRSTMREGYLMKRKTFVDGEGVVVDLEEGQSNQNAATLDELGRTKRSTHQENMAPSGMVGTLIVMDKTWGKIRVAPGTMTHAERIAYWQAHTGQNVVPGLVGKTIHWRSFGYGVMNAPRFPRFYSVREDV
jgi:DNA ligase 1